MKPRLDPACVPPVTAHAQAAQRLVADRYPDALGAVLGGSCARGAATSTSDLDITVVLPDSGVTRWEVLHHEGRPAEVFLNTRADLGTAFAESRITRRGTALFLFAESVVLFDRDGHIETLLVGARELLAAGPEPLTPDESEAGRFLLTDLLDDLADSGDRHEQLAVADRVLREAAHLLSAHHRAWNGAGKWLPRRLEAADPELGPALLRGHLAVAESADPRPLAAAVRTVLDLLGGPLGEGDVVRRVRSAPGNPSPR